ncbi:MAG: DNA polymerase III subunit gamma and tau [Geodermatophilaceae bacterium]
MALALYRKYRPASFAEVVGQDHVTEPLIQAIRSGRINHAYLFSGPRGCGKTSSARIMARSLNCEQGPTPTPCGVCDSCVGLAPDGPGTLDVIEIDAASHGGVEDARELRERAHYAPVSSRYKVYIIDEAHMVTTQGFNALLKLVEEPPDFLVFIFATTEPDKVLATIRSRTHHYPFRLLPPGVMRGLLEQICEQEKVTVEPAVYPLVVRAGGGSARDSLSVLDQLFAGAGEEGLSYARTIGLLGVTDAALLDETVDGLVAADSGAVFGSIYRVVDAGHDPRRFAADLLERLRDLIVLDAVPDAAVKGMLDEPADQLERMADQAAKLGAATLSRLADIVHEGLTEMRGTTSARLLLELICARMLLPAAATDSGALLQRLERLERRMDIRSEPASSDGPVRRSAGEPRSAQPAPAAVGGRSAALDRPKPVPVSEPSAGNGALLPGTDPAGSVGQPATEPPSTHPAGPDSATHDSATHDGGTGSAVADGVDVAAIRQMWPELLDRVKQRRRVTAALMINATALSVDRGVLRLGIDSVALMRLLSQQLNLDMIALSLKDLLGVDWRVEAVVQQPVLGDAVEPDPRDQEPDEGPPAPPATRDPESDAVALLEKQLGARRIDPGQ